MHGGSRIDHLLETVNDALWLTEVSELPRTQQIREQCTGLPPFTRRYAGYQFSGGRFNVIFKYHFSTPFKK
jgi:hypothetical protein